MNSMVLGLLAETSVHPGAGRSIGVVDLPVAREATTGYPVIVGSSLKGALRQAAEQHYGMGPQVNAAFGTPGRVGGVAVSDARLLLLPVRSLSAASRWATCPQLIERLGRDLVRAGRRVELPVAEVSQGEALTKAEGQIFVEECSFRVRGEPSPALINALMLLIKDNYEGVRSRLCDRLVVLSDDDFTWFCDFGLPVQARNQLVDETKQSQNLWYEESLPPDTLMYALLHSRDIDALTIVSSIFDNDAYVQVGGNATVGQGWFSAAMIGGDK
jgi:CRISPR-associated protein Cmr4